MGEKRIWSSRCLTAIIIESLARGLLVPVLSLIFLQKGFSLAQLSGGIAVYSAVALIMEVPSGVVADMFGRKRTFIFSQLTYAAVLALMLAVKGTAALYFLMGGYGIARALASGSMDALYIDTCLNERGEVYLTKAATRQTLWATVGLAAGALSGGVINWAGGQFWNGDHSSLTVLPAAFALTLAAAAAALFTKETPALRENAQDQDGGKTNGIKRQAASICKVCRKTPLLLVLLGSTVFTGTTLALMETYWQPRFLSLLPESNFTWLLGVLGFLYFAASAAGTIAAGQLMVKKSPVKTYMIFAILFGVCLAALGCTENGLIFAVLYLLFYFLLGISSTAQSVSINAAAPPAFRATLLSVQGLALQLGGFLSSCMASISADRLGIPGLWWCGAGLLILGIGLTAFMVVTVQPSAIRQPSEL
ncbi:MFS transporter [Murimonas intestini]|uniref:MFS family arabinose efflux permease n=1 Tax=Murimonas intestini TaxID=1337051 RepID=A0AB73T971_9FIRM|nr:MFS transporter [Murimonas intestini]MCR1839347.1 MFS transporter [Murimonas intestini]MCR1864642.1 MFS transporter [Murimonas intestini]MCR1882252.1 MFS transporter [Murimonas intestini]